jgi:hypothetical protein
LFKKTILATIAALILLTSSAVAALANPYTFGAENGRTLPPAGLGIDLSARFNQPDQEDKAFNAEVSYGIAPSITLAGELRNVNQSDRQTLVKAYFNPRHNKTMGYTAYLGYDLGEQNIPMYGLSVWTNFNFLYGYLNVETGKATDDEMMITPGASLQLGSKLRLGGEVTMKADDWSSENLRLGASYALTRKIHAKVMVDDNLADDSSRIYTTALTVQI